MSPLLKLEGFALGVLAIVLYAALGYPWWWYLALFLLPDVSMLGYLGGTKLGAATYNLAHHQGVAIAVYLAGMWLDSGALLVAGTVLLGHSGLDRVVGYGLKYPDAFTHTHLDAIA